jgi:hypothetical protein
VSCIDSGALYRHSHRKVPDVKRTESKAEANSDLFPDRSVRLKYYSFRCDFNILRQYYTWWRKGRACGVLTEFYSNILDYNIVVITPTANSSSGTVY